MALPLYSYCGSGSSAGGQDHVPAGALPQLLHQQLQVLLHLLCRRRKCCYSSFAWSIMMSSAGDSTLCLLSLLPLLFLLLLLFRPARSALTLPVKRRPGGSGPPSAICSTDGSAKQVRRFLLQLPCLTFCFPSPHRSTLLTPPTMLLVPGVHLATHKAGQRDHPPGHSTSPCVDNHTSEPGAGSTPCDHFFFVFFSTSAQFSFV